MADNDNLRTASLYINNQLLSRGLLRDGQTINFADPDDNPGGVEATMGKIMSIVNDLILRRDRDAEHRENLSATLRTIRAENLRYTNDIARLSEKHTEAQRKVDISEATENALRTQLKSADAAVRGLKDEVARAKTLVAQTRASCATEVRRRDRQIDGLKKQLGDAGRPRGTAKSSAVTVISVVAGEGEEKISPKRGARATANTDDSSYDLRKETNEFLTELSHNLSEENESLLSLVRRTTKRLREMSGCDARASQGDGHAVTLATAEDMATELDAILEHLRSILTNPSFAPIEEVEIREEEIARLRAGWVKMENRWQEAVHLIDGWRRRMAVDGKPVNMEELKMGLRLSPVRVRDVEETHQGGMDMHELSCVQEECTADLEEEQEQEEGGEEEEEDEVEEEYEAMPESPCPAPQRVESLHLVPAPQRNNAGRREVQYDDVENQSDYESSIYEDVDVEELDVEEPNVQILQQSTAYLSSPPLPPAPQLSPLRDSSSAGNRDARPRREKAGDFTTITEEKTREVRAADFAPKPPPHLTQLPRSPQKPSYPVEDRSRTTSAASIASDSTHNGAPLKTPTESPPPSVDQTPTIRKLPKAPRLVAAAATAAAAPPPPVEHPSPTATARKFSEESNGSNVSNDGPPPGPATQPNGTKSTPARTPLRRVPSRLPLPRPAEQQPQQSPLTMATIAAKLAASEREADAARVRAKLKAARGSNKTTAPPPQQQQQQQQQTTQAMPPPPPETIVAVPPEPQQHNGKAAVPEQNQDLDPVKRDPPQDEEQPLQQPKRKRDRRVSKVVSRRRSTLSPWEMESLISGNVAVPPSPAR